MDNDWTSLIDSSAEPVAASAYSASSASSRGRVEPQPIRAAARRRRSSTGNTSQRRVVAMRGKLSISPGDFQVQTAAHVFPVAEHLFLHLGPRLALQDLLHGAHLDQPVVGAAA